MYADMEKEGLDSAGGGVAMMTRFYEEYESESERNERKVDEQWPAYCPDYDSICWQGRGGDVIRDTVENWLLTCLLIPNVMAHT
jgi:hypothetical protein